MTLIEYKFIFTYRPIRMNWNWSMIRNRLKLLNNWKRLPKRSRRDYCGNRKTSCSVNGRNGILSSHKTTYSALRKAPPGSQKWENSYSRYFIFKITLHPKWNLPVMCSTYWIWWPREADFDHFQIKVMSHHRQKLEWDSRPVRLLSFF